MTQTPDSTSSSGGAAPANPDDAAQGVRGGSADRMDPAGPGTGGVTAGADGETAAREQLRKDLGERPADAGTDTGDALAQGDLGATDDPGAGSLDAPEGHPS